MEEVSQIRKQDYFDANFEKECVRFLEEYDQDDVTKNWFKSQYMLSFNILILFNIILNQGEYLESWVEGRIVYERTVKLSRVKILYVTYKTFFKMENYLHTILSQFKLSSHKLAIEKWRHTKPKTVLELRICKY